jgi:acetyl-CoA carboxylase carboxyl transferase subunit alpha
MMENAIYSVISPEGCAAILWKDRSKATQAAESLRLTAPDLEGLGIIDRVISEPLGGAHRDPDAVAAELAQVLAETLQEIRPVTPEERVRHRRQKFLAMGVIQEA